jgi:hypothetical protein
MFSVNFDKPGKHVIEVLDVVAADMKTPTGYNATATLGPAMDPSNPTKPSGGRRFRFRGWTGLATSDQPRIEIEVPGDARLTATFESQK